MIQTTIMLTQSTLRKLLNESESRYGFSDDARIFINERHGVQNAQHFAPHESPKDYPQVTSLYAEPVNDKDGH